MMTELSLNVLDVAQNSIKAKATLVEIAVRRNTAAHRMEITIRDDGCGMTKEQVEQVVDPFYTTRTTRKVGLGVPFFKMSAEMTGGSFRIDSVSGQGTVVAAEYCSDSIDMLPLGDMAATIISLVSVNPDIDFTYTYEADGVSFMMDTREVRQVLEGLPVNSGEVIAFIRDFIQENQAEVDSCAVSGI